MNLSDLLSILDIETAEEFEYFENFADLMEFDDEIPQDVFHQLISAVPMDIFIEILENYFDELLENLPDNAVDIAVTLETVKMSFSGLGKNLENERDIVIFSDELYRFRNWFTFDSVVHCKEQRTGEVSYTSLCEAIILCRIEKISTEVYEYDFDECEVFTPDEYVVSFSVEA